MSKPICTITNLQFCWNMKVDSYNNTIGDPDYFAAHYYQLGYRIRLVMAQNDDDGRPNHVVKSEDYNPSVEAPVNMVMHSKIVITQEYAEPVFMPTVEILPEVREQLTRKTPSEAYHVKKKVVPKVSYHRWKNIKAREPNKQICSVCECQRHNVRVRVGSKTMRWIYIDKDDNDLTEIPKCIQP